MASRDQRLSSTQVRARVDGGETPEATLRVVSLISIDEPVVTVNVAVGCPVKLSRRFVVFADPLPSSFSAPLTYQASPSATPAEAGRPSAPPATAINKAAPAAAPEERRVGDVKPAPKASAPRAPRVAKVSGSGKRQADGAAPG